jgi:DnaJ like chaperone protein
MKFPPVLVYVFALIIIILPAIVIYQGGDPGKEMEKLQAAKGIPTFIGFIIVVIFFTVYSKIKYRNSKAKWESGIFNQKQAFTEDALLEAYIRLGGLMLRKDRDDLKGKMAYLHRYFDQHFADSKTDFMNSMKVSYQHPVDLQSVSTWLKRNLRSQSQRSQLLYFLAGLSAVDGSINPHEKQYLRQLSDLLDISQKDFQSIMAMYSKHEDAYHDQFKQRRAPSKPRRHYKREKAAEILGVSLSASADEIKKAYRSLAKVHHPDRFATESESQQKIAKERFVKIQLAYELLLEHVI